MVIKESKVQLNTNLLFAVYLALKIICYFLFFKNAKLISIYFYYLLFVFWTYSDFSSDTMGLF
jgi:hypothetical protein